MSKITTITLGIIAGSVLAYNAYSLTCAQQPTCDSLGYTLTSTSDCIGTVLKCPFNTARYYCTTKTEALNKLTQDIVTAAMPVHSQRLSRSLGSSYTAGTNGYLIGYDWPRFDAGNSAYDSVSIQVIIDGVNVRVTNKNANWAYNTWSYPIKKDSTYKVTISGSAEGQYYFVPSK